MGKHARASDPAASGAADEGPGLEDTEADALSNRAVLWRQEKPPRNYVRLQRIIAKAEEQPFGKSRRSALVRAEEQLLGGVYTHSMNG